MAYFRRAAALIGERAVSGVLFSAAASQQQPGASLHLLAQACSLTGTMQALPACATSYLATQRRWKRSSAARRDPDDLGSSSSGGIISLGNQDDDDGDEFVLNWPLPDSVLAQASEELREVVEADRAARAARLAAGGADARDRRELLGRLYERLRNRLPGREGVDDLDPATQRGADALRTLVVKLKADELRRELADAGASTKGAKPALVERLMALLGAPPPAATTSPSSSASIFNPMHAAAAQRERRRQQQQHQRADDGEQRWGEEQRRRGGGAASSSSSSSSSDEGAAAAEFEDHRHQAWGESTISESTISGSSGSAGPGRAPEDDAPLTSAKQRRHGRVYIPSPPPLPPQTWDGASDPAAEHEAEQREFERVFTPQEVVDLLLEARAEDIAIVDVRGRCSWAEHFVVATGRSLRHVAALGQAVLYKVKQRRQEVAPGVRAGMDGGPGSEWVAVDAGSIVTHVFTEEARTEVDLEGLWATGDPGRVTRVALEDGAPQTLRTLRVDEGGESSLIESLSG